MLRAWISTSIGRHHRKARLSSSFCLSPQLSCEGTQAGDSSVSVPLQMGSTACWHYKCTQLMLSAVLMGFLSLSWHLCCSLNCSPVFPFQKDFKKCHVLSKKAEALLRGKSWIGGSSLEWWEMLLPSIWKNFWRQLALKPRWRFFACTGRGVRGWFRTKRLPWPQARHSVLCHKAACQLLAVLPSRALLSSVSIAEGLDFLLLSPNTDFSWWEVDVQRSLYSSFTLFLVLQQSNAGISPSLFLKRPVDAESTNEQIC